jgi:lipocalin
MQKSWVDLEKYKGLWVALNEKEEKVISSNKDAKSAYEAAKKMGVKIPILFKVPEFSAPYIGGV